MTSSTLLAGAESEDWRCDIPPQEKPPVLRDFCQIQLQLRETLPLAGKEARWVSATMMSAITLE